MKSSQKRTGSRSFSARAKRDLRPHPPTAGSQGREASPLKTKPHSVKPDATLWFGPQPEGRRKTARPFRANRPLEAKLTASRARGKWKLDRPENRASIRRILLAESKRSGIILRKVEISANELRLELKAERRSGQTLFFRALAGRIPRAVTGTERGRPLPRLRPGQRPFWDGLVATRYLPKTTG
jgi:hypothetical protein